MNLKTMIPIKAMCLVPSIASGPGADRSGKGAYRYYAHGAGAHGRDRAA